MMWFILLGVYLLIGVLVLVYAIHEDARILWSLTACVLIVLFYPYFLIKDSQR